MINNKNNIFFGKVSEAGSKSIGIKNCIESAIYENSEVNKISIVYKFIIINLSCY